MTADAAPIPLVLVTGFLGSGKTTLLQRLIERHRGRRIVFLVNEFSPRDVDGARLRSMSDAVWTIPGGSIFCRCLVGEFLSVLSTLPARFGTPGAPVEGVVVEASGMTDPRATRTLFREARLEAVYRFAAVAAVVDPSSFLKLVHTLPVVLAQVESAGLVLVNKTDLAPLADVEAAERAVREASPGVRVLRTVRCATEIDLFAGALPVREGTGELAACPDPAFARMTLRLSGDTDVNDLKRCLAELGDDLYRVKGFVRAGGRTLSVDVSLSGIDLAPAGDAGAGTDLVVIVRGPARLRALGLLSGLANSTVTV
jgi:G3E family GTPase